MVKNQEISNPDSCLNKAKDDELIFVLLGRDITAAQTIYCWCALRVSHGKNTWDDSQIKEAINIANNIKKQQDENKQSEV